MGLGKFLVAPIGVTGVLCLYVLYDKKKGKWLQGHLSRSFHLSNVRAWKCSTNPNCLLTLAQSNRPHSSLVGVRGLAALKNVPEWQRRSLWQRADASVYAALLLVDGSVHNYPLRVFYGGPDWESLHEEYINLLENLYEYETELCPRYHTEIALQKQRFPTSNAEDLMREFGKLNDQLYNHHAMLDSKRLISYLTALGVHSLWTDSCRVMYQSKILNTLWQSWHFPQFAKDAKIRCLILKIISNVVLSLPESKEVLARQGWFEELGKSRKSSNFELQLLASNVLENLAARFPDAPVFPEGVYLLQGSIWDGKNYAADIVFLHGLRGRVFRTWRQKEFIRRKDTALNDFLSKRNRTSCWAKDWLPNDLPYPVRLLAVDYDSVLSDWGIKCPSCYDRCTLVPRSRELASKLAKAGVGRRPIIWVCHSMGGLIVKEILRNLEMSNSLSPSEKSILTNTIGCVFYGTPHLGSTLATVSTKGALNTFILPSAEVNMLKEGSPYLLKLHEDFLDIQRRRRISCLSFVETVPTKVAYLKWNVMLVAENSASSVPGKVFRLKERHFYLCKPEDPEATSYRALVDFVSSLLESNRSNSGLFASSCTLLLQYF
uniref:Protein SERAC1 n=1 Tax=Trichuris muris TaxID=70415 RepID=A0A5S6Q3R9_TRIMR